MKIFVDLKKVVMNAYDDDYHIFVKTLLEGFMESPILCKTRLLIDYSSKKVSFEALFLG
jgi:hypothetical protein